ncbi:MAG TPA: hypothetical protein VF424_12625 [Vicinamibacterales bacterium]
MTPEVLVRRLLGVILIGEAALAGFSVTQSLPALPGYDAISIALILAGGAVGALQAVSGLMLLEGRPQGAALGQASLVLSAILTLLVVGFRLAPSDVYYWLRWKYVAGYLVYAVVGMWILQKKTSGVISAEERGRK